MTNPKSIFTAHWINDLGEECSSPVYSQFMLDGCGYYVVRRPRGQRLVVMPVEDFSCALEEMI